MGLASAITVMMTFSMIRFLITLLLSVSFGGSKNLTRLREGLVHPITSLRREVRGHFSVQFFLLLNLLHVLQDLNNIINPFTAMIAAP